MMHRTSVRVRRTGLWILVTILTAGVGIIAACGEDEAAIPPVEQDGSVPTIDAPPPNPSADDGGQRDDAEVVVEVEDDGGGGVLDDEDGGIDTDPDGGFDAGAACGPLSAGDLVDTTCGSQRLLWFGGELTTTTYRLTGVQVLFNALDCKRDGGYVPAEHRGMLKVTATSATAGTLEFLDQGRRQKARQFVTRRYDVTASALLDELTLTPTDCSLSRSPPKARYTVGTPVGGKKRLSIRLPYGAGNAIYEYTEL